MRAKQRSDRDLGTVHALNYFACPRAATPKSRESMATPPQRSRGEILITKFPKFLEETKKGKRKEEKEKKWKKRRKRRGSFETRRECVFMNTWKELVFSDEEKGHIQGKYY